MDKTAIIILLLIIIIIALLHKNGIQDEKINSSNIYNNANNEMNNIGNNMKNYYYQLEESQNYKNIENNMKNTFNQIGNGIENTYNNFKNKFDENKESFNNERLIANRLFNNNININNLPTGEGDFPVELEKNDPPYVQIYANKGQKFLSITNIDGIKQGDLIVINPNYNNSEVKFVTGIGNNILHLNKPLSNQHFPNEPIYNKYNNDVNNKKVAFRKVGYGHIDTETKDIDFTPESETWKFNVLRGNKKPWEQCQFNQECRKGYQCRQGGYTNTGRCINDAQCKWANWWDGTQTNCQVLYQPSQTKKLPYPKRNIQLSERNRRWSREQK